MNVLFVLPPCHTPSGWRTLAFGIINAMKQHTAVNPTLIIHTKDKTAVTQRFPHLPTITLPAGQADPPGNWRTWPRWAAAWAKLHTQPFKNIDLVHSLEAYPTGLIGHWLAQRLGCPHIITIAGTYGVIWHRYPRERRLYARVLARAAALCPISHGTLQKMQQQFAPAMTHTPSHVVHLGTPSEHLLAQTAVNNRTLPHTPTLLSVAAVKRRKGFHSSIAAFAKAKQHLPNARYIIIGSTDQEATMAQLHALIQQSGVTDVEFWGRVSAETVQQAYQQATLFLLTPEQAGDTFEGFGFVYIEAGGYGLPVIGTQHGGVPDAILDGQTGILCPEGDVDAIADAIVKLATDAPLNLKLGHANRAWAASLSWARFAQQQMGIYEAVLS